MRLRIRVKQKFAIGMAIRVLLLLAVLFFSFTCPSFSLYEDQVGLLDWHQQYIGKVKQAVFHTQKTGRKRVVVSTEENVIASLDLRHGEIIWRHVLGSEDVVDGIDLALGKYVITLSSEGTILRAWNLPDGQDDVITLSSEGTILRAWNLPDGQDDVITLSSEGTILRAWNLPDGQMVWESFLQGPKPSKSLLFVPKNLKVDKDNLIVVFGRGSLHAVSSIDGEVLWKMDFMDESVEVQQIIQTPGSDDIYAVGSVGSSQFVAYKINTKNGELLKRNLAALPGGLSQESLLVSSYMLVALDATREKLLTVNFRDGEISFKQTHISDLAVDSTGVVNLLPSKLPGMFAVKINELATFVRVTDDGRLEVVGKIKNAIAVSDALSFSDEEQAFALVERGGGKIHLNMKLTHDWNGNLLKESTLVDQQRGSVHKVFINNYIRTDRTHGFRALIVMEDHSLLLLQQGEVVWSREDGLASIVDVATSELPVRKEGASVTKVEENLFEWLKGHLLKLKGTLIILSPEDVAVIQGMRQKYSEKSKMTRDHNGFRKLLIVLTRAGKILALHTGDGQVVWSLLLSSLRTDACSYPTGCNIYQWQVPHHRAMDVNPSILIVGQCGKNSNAPGVLSFVDTYTGKEINALDLRHSVTKVIPLPITDSTEQRLHLLIDNEHHAHLYPKTSEAIHIFAREFPNIYWYSVDADEGIIKGHVLRSKCVHKAVDDFCFDSRDIWSIVFPSDSERIIATASRKLNEVVHTQAKVIGDRDVMYKYISKNLLFVATVAPKANGEIGTATPEESWLVVYLIDTITGRILHRMTHHGSQGPVHAVLSENWVVYHYFNLRAHRYEISVIEIYDQSRVDNKDVWKLVLGKHNLTSPISSYSRPEIVTKSQSYFFTHSVKEISVTSTAKGITSKQLLIGTIGDQVLALDKRYVDPRRSANPTQAEQEEGIIPLTDSLPINPQSYVTHALRLEGLKGIVSFPAKLESTTHIFLYGVDIFYTRMAPSRTYDSLTEDFSYALLLITIVALIAAIFVTWILSKRKDLQDKWR